MLRNIYKQLRFLGMFIKSYGRPKIFCLSFQRTGTKSVGMFFKNNGFVIASHGTSQRNHWSDLCVRKDYNKITRSYAFKRAQFFEDSPWFYPDFYRYLFWKYPNSKFIFLKRDPNKWFDSMMSHSKNKTLGKTHNHAKIYRRLEEFFNHTNGNKLFENSKLNGLDLQEKHRSHYVNIYEEYEREMINFFRHFDKKRLFYGELEDPDVWFNLGKFMKIDVKKETKIHTHKSNN